MATAVTIRKADSVVRRARITVALRSRQLRTGEHDGLVGYHAHSGVDEADHRRRRLSRAEGLIGRRDAHVWRARRDAYRNCVAVLRETPARQIRQKKPRLLVWTQGHLRRVPVPPWVDRLTLSG